MLLKAAPQWFIMAPGSREDWENTTVNNKRVDEGLDGNPAGTLWTAAEESFLMLARELEWAEAYSADHPTCPMGRVYLDFLQWEMITAQDKW